MVTAVAATMAPPAAAEGPVLTKQAEVANARFLAFAPPPEHGAGAVCLVDTGLDLNPDTAGNVVARAAIDGGDPGDVHPSKHGTRMAMVMSGPVNGWGSVGACPLRRRPPLPPPHAPRGGQHTEPPGQPGGPTLSSRSGQHIDSVPKSSRS